MNLDVGSGVRVLYVGQLFFQIYARALMG